MTGLDVAVGFLVAWFARKAGRVGKRLDGLADGALDAGLDALHDVVMNKLGVDPALEKLAAEAGATGDAGARTRARVALALEEAVEDDPQFAAELGRAIQTAQGASAAAGDRGVAIVGGVRADHGGVAIGGVTGGSVVVERPDPSEPAGISG